jgi:ribosomal protein L40E
VVDLQEANSMNREDSLKTNDSETLTTTKAASSDLRATASVASESSPQSSKFCSECGAKISARAEVCPKCGARLAPAYGGEHNKTTAALLALFLGGLGAHKFYLGRTGMGFLYLVCCWTLIPAFISLVEGIQFLSMSESEFALKYR